MCFGQCLKDAHRVFWLLESLLTLSGNLLQGKSMNHINTPCACIQTPCREKLFLSCHRHLVKKKYLPPKKKEEERSKNKFHTFSWLFPFITQNESTSYYMVSFFCCIFFCMCLVVYYAGGEWGMYQFLTPHQHNKQPNTCKKMWCSFLVICPDLSQHIIACCDQKNTPYYVVVVFCMYLLVYYRCVGRRRGCVNL